MKECYGFMHNGVTWTLDPMQKFTDADPQRLVAALGLIPEFIAIMDEGEDLKEYAVAAYGYGGFPMKGGTVTKEGVWQYPGDPDLYPYAKCITSGYTVYVYAYGFIAFIHEESGEVTRYRFD